MAAGTVNPKRVTSLTAIMLETISVVTKTATMIGYQRPGAGLLDSISSRNAGKSCPGRPGAMFGLDRDPDTAANGEGAADATPAGIERCHQIVEDRIGDVLVERAAASADHVPRAAESTGFRGACRLAAAWAGQQAVWRLADFHREGAVAFSLEEREIESQLRARASCLQAGEGLLVVDRRRPYGERAFIVDVVDPAQQGVCGGLAFVQPAERFDLARQAPLHRRQHRPLARQVAG